MLTKLLLVALLTFTAALASQDVPIPKIPDGYSLGSATPSLHLEAFFDLLCDDCRDTWAVLEPILRNEFHVATNQTLRFTIHLTTLLNHVNGLWANIGARVIANNLKAPEDMWRYFNLIFSHQEAYYPTATMYLTQAQVIQNFVDLISTNMPEYADVIKSGIQYGSQADTEARIAWKYACSRGVNTTPHFLANGVIVNGAANWQANDWRNFLNGGYLGKRSQTIRVDL